MLDELCSGKRAMVHPSFAIPDRSAILCRSHPTPQGSKHDLESPLFIAGITLNV